MKLAFAILIPIVIISTAVAGLMMLGVLHHDKPPKKRVVRQAAPAGLPAQPLTTPPPQPAALNPLSTPAQATPPADVKTGEGTGAAGVDSAKATSTINSKANDKRVKPDVESDRKIARLTSLYESMPAEEAATILAKVPDPLVVQVLKRMDDKQAGKILLVFGPERAAKLTLALAPNGPPPPPNP